MFQRYSVHLAHTGAVAIYALHKLTLTFTQTMDWERPISHWKDMEKPPTNKSDTDLQTIA